MKDKMMRKLFVGNLAWAVSDADLKGLFSEFGDVHASMVICDHVTGQSRGFGFVQMDASSADLAVTGLNGKPLHGRELDVSLAKENTAA